MFARVFSKPWSKNPALLIGGTSCSLNVILWALVLTQFPHDDSAAVLHYNIATGIDLIGEGTQIAVLPATGLALIVGNGALAMRLGSLNGPAAWAVWSIVPILQVILLGAFILIWQAN